MIGWPAARRRVSRSASSSRGDLLRRLGRGVLWALVLVLLLRGVAGLVERRRPAAGVRVERPAAAVWPDDEARAFAATFARAYMTTSPRDSGGQVRALAGFVSPELARTIAPELGERPRAEAVRAVVFARATVVDSQHARRRSRAGRWRRSSVMCGAGRATMPASPRSARTS